MGSGDDVKRAAQRAINSAATAELGSIGLQRRGRSGRSWFDDHGWWRINVGFSASAWSVKVSLIVGVQYYWQLADHVYVESVLETGSVAPYPTGALDGSIGPPEAVATAYARDAARQVQEVRAARADERLHLEQCADPWWPEVHSDGSPVPPVARRDLSGPVAANAVLGRLELARELVTRQRHILATDTDQYLHEELTVELEGLQRIVDAPHPRPLVEERINQGRGLLSMEPVPRVLGFLDH